MELNLRDRAAAVIAAVAVVLGIGALGFGTWDPGVRLEVQGDRIVIREVNPNSIAQLNGLQPGFVVVRINELELIRLPQYVYPPGFDDGYDPVTGEGVAPIGVSPERPTPVGYDEASLHSFAAMPIRDLEATHPSHLASGVIEDAFGTYGLQDWWGRSQLQNTAPALVIGLGMLIAGAWWLASGRAAASLVPLALPLAVASATPFLLRPLQATWSPLAMSMTGALIPLAIVPLGLALADRVEATAERRMVRWASAACAGVAVALGAVQPFSPPWPSTTGALWGLLVGAVAIIPGLAAAGLLTPTPRSPTGPSSGRVLTSAELALAGATPLVALGTDAYPYVFPMALWVAAIALAGRFTIRPLARLATRATLQRDLVVAATEAERARVAADIHDDALQELSLLVRRLDAQGDTEGADIARQVSDRLRAICGDLRLPILDDLGVGPALDWLVLRIERLAGGEVRLERNDATRPPADVELAFFRVAQEALANAVKHGRPPIVVRYHATPAGASLSIDDAGPGIAAEAGSEAEREGRFGLLNMQQRAEQIGAILDIRRWPSGGTHVALEWRPR
jgi:signal transduction histidine kinase